MTAVGLPDRALDFEVPADLIADHPVEHEGRRRDEVRMLVAERSTGALVHARAADLPRFLDAGDVLVVNTSPTLPAAIPSVDGTAIVHLSTDLGGGRRPCWATAPRSRSSGGRCPSSGPRSPPPSG